MPVWTWDEISACISKNVHDGSTENLDVTSKILCPKVDYGKAKKLFGMRGEMEGAIRICDLDMIVKIIGDVVDPKLEINNKIVHIYNNVPDEEQDNVDNNTMDASWYQVKELVDLKNVLDITKEIKFYFVMPPGCFDGMKKQPFHARKGED
nr:12823_t:CDS:2 [Entrophospora candida]